jgi:hypothetical protein
MNAQLRDIAAIAYAMMRDQGIAPLEAHTASDRIGERVIAALAAPNEAGDDWAEAALCLSNEVLSPMECPDTPERWLDAMRGTWTDFASLLWQLRVDRTGRLESSDATIACIDRLAAPSKEAGPEPVKCRHCHDDGIEFSNNGDGPYPCRWCANPPGDQRQEGEYDCELVADMLEGLVYDDGYGMKSRGPYTVEAIAEQARLLREADNRDAAGVHTALAASRPPEAAAAVGEATDDITRPQDGVSPHYTPEAAIAYIRDWCPDHVKDYIAALASPTGPQPAGGGVDWRKVEEAAKSYVEDYEFIGEDDSGREGSYTPKEWERTMILDAIYGLLSDDDFSAAIKGDSHAG